jgi:LuxR family maltose regulon positive regulatory protein
MAEGDSDVAEWHGRCAVELLDSKMGGSSGDFVWVRVSLSDALRVNGKLSEARTQLNRSLESEAPLAAPMIHGLVLVSDAELALAEIDRPRAAARTAQAHKVFDSCVDVGSEPWRRLAQVEANLAAPKLATPPGSAPTGAEMRVLDMLAVTANRGQIARELYLSESTVKTHLRRIYKRLGVASREEALAVARERGLLSSVGQSLPRD